jgi:uracil-DNA glycosylase
MVALEKICSFKLEPSWQKVLKDELEQPYIQDLIRFVESERERGENVYPPEEEMFKSLWQTPFSQVKVVIIGQDPYHGPGQANGLSFSVNKGVTIPPSLKNIFTELHNDLGITNLRNGSLEDWAKQGVLLLNATLTVTESNPMAHHNKGWEKFTDAIVYALLERIDPIIFVLWGKNAQDKCQHIRAKANHRILTASHPSPLSAYRGFFGCRHFSKINEMLIALGSKPIKWQL